MISSIIMCKLQKPPFKMSESARNMVVSPSTDALAPKPKKKERLRGEKKPKKQKKTTEVPLEEILPEPGPSTATD